MQPGHEDRAPQGCASNPNGSDMESQGSSSPLLWGKWKEKGLLTWRRGEEALQCSVTHSSACAEHFLTGRSFSLTSFSSSHYWSSVPPMGPTWILRWETSAGCSLRAALVSGDRQQRGEQSSTLAQSLGGHPRSIPRGYSCYTSSLCTLQGVMCSRASSSKLWVGAAPGFL